MDTNKSYLKSKEMVDYQMGAVMFAICSLPFIISPVANSFLIRTLRAILRFFKLNSTYCRTMCWKDLTSGHLHIYRNAYYVQSRTNISSQSKAHMSSKECYDSIFTNVLSRAWPRSKERKVVKPPELSLGNNYLLTDGDTLLTFIALTASGHRSFSSSIQGGFGEATFTFRLGSGHARFQRFNSNSLGEPFLVGHLNYSVSDLMEPIVVTQAANLTKADVLRIVNGYPPFYKETFITHSGVPVDYPIKDPRDIQRAGWLIAVGLDVREPLNVYNEHSDKAYREACNRVLKTVTHVFQPSFSKDSDAGKLCQLASSAIYWMNSNRSGSGVPKFLQDSPLVGCDGAGVARYTRHLRREECRFAINIFWKYSFVPLTDLERDRLEKILPAVLAAAICGVYRWWQYKNNTGGHLPSWLLADSIRLSPIWLRDCCEDMNNNM
ncbi:hypothetical protein M501DRAFT_987212 [Patellaria atrata CBS 101060]|uniref:Uncharacterized protein n=1 Tax=Patellaria atrata CBS 101060 TaxID=1346257 RepID=A0A9P4S741_9PEZI|nr:hypothetical protein M501DRAFT_987212 [Patellaria atrata CBS 101060]